MKCCRHLAVVEGHQQAPTMRCDARTKTRQQATALHRDWPGGGVRTVHAPHVIKSAEVEELSKAEARNFDHHQPDGVIYLIALPPPYRPSRPSCTPSLHLRICKASYRLIPGGQTHRMGGGNGSLTG